VYDYVGPLRAMASSATNALWASLDIYQYRTANNLRSVAI
jgi:hypothetical protein